MRRRDISKVLLASAAGTTLPAVPPDEATKANDLRTALQAHGAVRVPVGIYPLTSKLQTLVQNNISGDSRHDTILRPSSFPDYVLEVGNGNPGPNAGKIERLRFYGAPGNLGCLHMNNLSHMWRLDDLLFSGGPCPAIVADNCWDSNYTDIDILAHHASGTDPAQTAAVIFRNGSNNLYCRGLRIEGALSGGLYVDSGPIYVVTGKIDDGFGGPQSAAAITVAATGSLIVEDFYLGGMLNQFHIDLAGALKLGKVALDGGSNRPAAINDRRMWSHVNPQTSPTYSPAIGGPFIPGLDLGDAQFHRFHPSVNTETPAAVYSKIHPIRQVKNLATRANGVARGNTLMVGTTVGGSHNDLYKNSFLVHNGTGQRRKILGSFAGGNLVLEGTEPVMLDSDWSIEYCESHDTPIRHANVWLGPEQTLFAVVAGAVTMAGTPAIYVSDPKDPAYGTTTFEISGAALHPGQDLTGLYFVDNVTEDAHYIEYGMDARGRVGVIYDQRAALDPSHEFCVVAGHVTNTASDRSREVRAKNAAPFAIPNPDATRRVGVRLTLTVSNETEGPLGEVTWGTEYRLAPWVNPALGHSRSIEFRYNGKNWIEVARTPADVPN